jgi:hypothetical protein
MAAFEKIIHAQHLRFALSKGEFAADMPRFSHLHQSPTKEYQTDIFSDDVANADARAEQIIKNNLAPKADLVDSTCPE